MPGLEVASLREGEFLEVLENESLGACPPQPREAPPRKYTPRPVPLLSSLSPPLWQAWAALGDAFADCLRRQARMETRSMMI